jgi:DNA adenine methylase
MAKHDIYVEPFGGAASVLLNKPRAELEIYNDLNPNIANLMRFIRDEHDHLVDNLRSIPCEEKVYYEWKEKVTNEPFECAIRCFVLLRMSRGGTATTFSKSKRTYRGLPENVAAWDTGISNLQKVSDRLKGVEIKNQDALQLLKDFSSPNALWYLDPPYVAASRKNAKVYEIEMANESHQELSRLCHLSKSNILLSGYESDLYSTLFADWTCEKKAQYLHGGHGRQKQLTNEVLWKNF